MDLSALAPLTLTGGIDNDRQGLVVEVGSAVDLTLPQHVALTVQPDDREVGLRGDSGDVSGGRDPAERVHDMTST